MFGVNVRMHFPGCVCKVVSSFILLFAFLQSECLAARFSRSSCTTVWKREGTCVPLNQCPVLLDVVSALQSNVDQNTRRNQINHLQESQCGGTPMTPMVCCPKEHRNIHLVNQENCGDASTGKVGKGKEAIPFEFPWMALIAYEIENTIGYECGGSLINSRYVLTAAHCIKTRYKAVGVRLGEHNIRQPADCYTNIKKCPRVQDIRIEKTIVHEHYNDKVNDIALIRLAQNAVMRVNVFPICLPVTPTLRLESLLDKLPWIAGWGTTETVDTFSNVLRKARLTVISNTKCQDMFSTSLIRVEHISELTKGKFCAFGPEGEDSCSGDSGGPLMLPLRYKNEERYIIFGIVSYGSKQCSAGRPSVFTKVDEYLEWILDNLRP